MDHPNDSIRMFRNEDGGSIFPDGLVRIVRSSHAEPDMFIVRYLDPPSGFEDHSFFVAGRELTTPTASVLQARDFWIVTASPVPTFYLNGVVQGIVDEAHARRLAAAILGSNYNKSVHVARVSDIVS